MKVYLPDQEQINPPQWCVDSWGEPRAAADLLGVPLPLLHLLIDRGGIRSENRGGATVYRLDDLWRAATAPELPLVRVAESSAAGEGGR